MGEIVNLRQVKKCRDRDAKAAEAAENRARYGRTGPQKANDRRVEARRAALMDGVRVTPDNAQKTDPRPGLSGNA